MATPHFIYSRQTLFNTWVTPSKWLPVESSEIGGEREVLPIVSTGAGRATYLNVLGAKPVSGPMVCPWWCTQIGPLLLSFMRDTAVTLVTAGVYDHGLAFDDSQDLLPISIQQQYTGTLAINVLSAIVNTLTIAATAKEKVMLNWEFIAKDEARSGATWDYDGSTSAPAVITTPAYPAIQRPLMFYDAGVSIGGTPSWDGTGKKISVAGGTSYPKIDNIQFAISLNVDTEGYALNKPDPTIQEAVPGAREIAVTFDISWSDYATTFYDAARAGTAMAVVLDMVGPVISGANRHEAHIIAPSVFFDPKKLPPLTGDQTRKKMTVTGMTQVDGTTGKDFNIWIRTSEATL